LGSTRRALKVPFSRPLFTGEEAAALAEVIASRWVTQGPAVAEFEREFAERVGARHAVAVSNGTTALHLALLTAGVGHGDEVIVPSLSFIATANVVRHCGATPIFADVDRRMYNLDPVAAEAAITARTKAIMPVHQLGLPADVDELATLCASRGIALIEDAACAIGATYRGRPIGSLESPACFSLHPRKTVTTGEGGMITTPDDELAVRLRRLRHHGMSVSDLVRHSSQQAIFEEYSEVGYNYRMSDLHAALGSTQLAVLERMLASRRRLAERYTELLADVPEVEPPFEPPDRTHPWQSYMIRLRDTPVARDDLIQSLLDEGIATRRGVMAIHLEAPYAQPRYNLPETEAAARSTLILPLFPELTDEEQDYVVERLAHHVSGAA
jgi:perosamine synthetase